MVRAGPADGSRAGEAAVDGAMLAAVLDGAAALSPAARERGADALADRGVERMRSGGPHEFDAALDALAACTAAEEASLVALGAAVVPALSLSPADPTVPAGMRALTGRLRATHRGGAGDFEFRHIGRTDGRVEAATPYPCPFVRGLVNGVVEAYGDGLARVQEVGHCRADGGDRCTYELVW